MPRFWMIFATKSGNAGVIITDASDFAAALAKTIETGINPGPHTTMQAQAVEVLVIPERYLDRLLTGDELEAVQTLPQGIVYPSAVSSRKCAPNNPRPSDKTPVTRLHRYVTCRAKQEGQTHELDEQYYLDAWLAGVRVFLVIIVNGDGKIQSDQQDPNALAAWKKETPAHD